MRPGWPVCLRGPVTCRSVRRCFMRRNLSNAPVIGEDGLLRLNGRIPMRPEAVQFEMLFAQAGTEWRLFGLSVGRGGRAPDDESEARE